MPRCRGWVLLFVFPILFTTSCEKFESPSEKSGANNANVLRFDVSAPLTSLDPTKVRLSGSTVVFPLLYSYLFLPDEAGRLEPDLAVHWDYKANHHVWTIHLRGGARFHDHTLVTSKDVTYSLETGLATVRPALYGLIERVSLPSDTIICLRLRQDDPDFLKKIWDMEIVPKSNTHRIDYDNHPIGSGPFRFKSRQGQTQVTLEANPDYFLGRPALDAVVFHFQPDKERAWARLLAGTTDIVQEISPKNYQIMKQYEKEYYFDLYTLWYYTILLYNTKDPLFSDPKVRLALAYAIDKEYIVQNLLKGLGKVAVGPMGVDSPYHNPEVRPIPYDPGKAVALLNQAGWSYDVAGRYLEKQGNEFEFTILVLSESQIEKKVARYLRLCLNDLGIKARVQPVLFNDLKRTYVKNNAFQAVLTEFRGAYRDPEYLKQLWSPGPFAPSGAGAFDAPEVSRLINQALAEKDPSRRKVLFYRLDALLTALQPGTFLFQKTAIDVMSKRFFLPEPFSLTFRGIHHLAKACLR
ncbi:MAG: ABC transporter substrate-binding protein [Deltaproteobacteria bacterium]|nr:ABC transporter substrate-binding protein [Deltaproteobacteria bacterium]